MEALRRQTKHGPARLAADLQRLHGVTLAPATVHRILVRRGHNRLRDLNPPTGEQLREVIRYDHDRVGDLVHVDVKKLGRIPTGGGWRMHGVGTESARASKRTGCIGENEFRQQLFTAVGGSRIGSGAMFARTGGTGRSGLS